VMTTSGFGAGDQSTTLFYDASQADTKRAYEAVCPSVRAAIDYRAFGYAILRNPWLRHNAGFDGARTTMLLGSGVQRLSGYLGTLTGVLPAEVTLATEAGKTCVAAASVAGVTVFPPWGAAGPPAPAAEAYLDGSALQAAVSGKSFAGSTSGGLPFSVSYGKDGSRSVEIVFPDGTHKKDSGTWRVVDNKLCKTESGGSAEACTRYLSRPDGALEAFDEEGFSHTVLQLRPAAGP
jgi:hypothetical protein